MKESVRSAETYKDRYTHAVGAYNRVCTGTCCYKRWLVGPPIKDMNGVEIIMTLCPRCARKPTRPTSEVITW